MVFGKHVKLHRLIENKNFRNEGISIYRCEASLGLSI